MYTVTPITHRIHEIYLVVTKNLDGQETFVSSGRRLPPECEKADELTGLGETEKQ